MNVHLCRRALRSLHFAQPRKNRTSDPIGQRHIIKSTSFDGELEGLWLSAIEGQLKPIHFVEELRHSLPRHPGVVAVVVAHVRARRIDVRSLSA